MYVCHKCKRSSQERILGRSYAPGEYYECLGGCESDQVEIRKGLGVDKMKYQMVEQMARLMDAQLIKNESKGNAENTGLSRQQLIAQLRECVHVLENACVDNETAKIEDKALIGVTAADVANLATLVANETGGLREALKTI